MKHQELTHKLTRFLQAAEEGKLLLIVDLPEKRIAGIREWIPPHQRVTGMDRIVFKQV